MTGSVSEGAKDSLFLEDFDIIKLLKRCPEASVGVSVSRIYIQIAKYSFDEGKQKELMLLSSALSKARGSKPGTEPRYIPMSVAEVGVCFGSSVKQLRKYPLSTFKKMR